MKTNRVNFFSILCFAASFLAAAPVIQASTVVWKGYTWTIKSAIGAGPGPNNWNANNVFVDTNGCLHLLINYNTASSKWDCAEVSTTSNLGFGTYQWQVESSVDAFDPWVVLGMFPYLGPDGRNEIDVEFSRWGKPGSNNGWWTVYPSAGSSIGQKTYSFALTGTYTTSRFTWSGSGVQFWLMGGFQPTGTTTNVINSWNYTPTNPQRNIPQKAMPLHMNLWLYQGHAPADGLPVEVIIHDFTKV